jgi:hypothetical protein
MHNCGGQERGRGRKWRTYRTKNRNVKRKSKKCENNVEEAKMEVESEKRS